MSSPVFLSDLSVPFPSVSIDQMFTRLTLPLAAAWGDSNESYEKVYITFIFNIPAALSEESELVMFHRDDFVQLTDDIKSWIVFWVAR